MESVTIKRLLLWRVLLWRMILAGNDLITVDSGDNKPKYPHEKVLNKQSPL